MDSHAQTTTIDTQTSSASSSRDSSPNTPITPLSPASSAGSGYFSRSSSGLASPQVPYHIIVTFDGKVREMLRIERQSEDMGEERRSRRTTPRPRYYARNTEE